MMLRSPITADLGCLLVLTATFVLPSCGSHQVVADGSGDYTGKGATYYLPRTVIIANVPVVRKDTTPGEFASYAQALFFKPVKDFEKTTTFSIGDDISIDAAGERDPDKRYTSIFAKGFAKSATQIYSWNDQGVLTSGKATVEDKTVDFVVSTIQTAAKLASSSSGALSNTAKSGMYPNVAGITRLKNHLNSLDKHANSIKLTEPGLRVGLSIEMSENPGTAFNTLKGSTDEDVIAGLKNWQDFEKENYNGLSEMKRVGQVLRQIKSSLDNMDAAHSIEIRKSISADIDAAMGSFYGKSTESVTILQFRWVPPARDPKQTSQAQPIADTLFTLDSNHGVVLFNRNPEKAPTSSKIKLSEKEKLTHAAGAKHLVKIQGNAKIPTDSPNWELAGKSTKKKGWYYAIPADSSLSITVNDAKKASKIQGIAQQGLVGFLPSTGGGSKVISDIELDPATGALKSLSQGTVAFDPALVNKVGDAASGWIASERKADDPLTALKREKEELELRAAIKKAREALSEE